MATFLPEDVVVKILLRLPPKSLLRFRTVSKSWLSLIGTPDFLSKNLLNDFLLTPSPTTQNSHLLIKRTVLSPTPRQIYSSLSCNTLDDDDEDCASQIALERPPLLPVNHKILGSSNGLVCLLSRSEKDIFLWNPATSALKQLPRASSIYVQNFCFGFDANSNDFKVTRIYLPALQPPEIPNRYHREAEVYSLSSGCWRKLDVDVPHCVSFESHWRARAYLNGVCFWLVVNENIVAFDVSQEVFKTSPLPDSVSGDRHDSPKNLTVLNESLALIVSPQQSKEKCFDIWVLFEFGVKESWTRLVTITPFTGLERPLGSWKNGELFMENTEGQLVLYNPFTQTVRSLHVCGVKKSLQVFGYTPSSFPIDNA